LEPLDATSAHSGKLGPHGTPAASRRPNSYHQVCRRLTLPSPPLVSTLRAAAVSAKQAVVVTKMTTQYSAKANRSLLRLGKVMIKQKEKKQKAQDKWDKQRGISTSSTPHYSGYHYGFGYGPGYYDYYDPYMCDPYPEQTDGGGGGGGGGGFHFRLPHLGRDPFEEIRDRIQHAVSIVWGETRAR
jgi:hypothetical protein